MTKKNRYLKTSMCMWMELFVFLTLLFTVITFANQNYDLDEFDDLELKSLDKQKEKTDDNKHKQRLILFDENLYLLDDNFDFGKEELELLKLELNQEDIELSQEYEDFLKAFFENSTPIGSNFIQQSNTPEKNHEKYSPSTTNEMEEFTPVESNSFKQSNTPEKNHEKYSPSTTNEMEEFTPTITLNNQLSLFSRIGFGMNSWYGSGIITGGAISYGNNKWGKIGADLMYLVNNKKHTFGIIGFYERKILKYIVLKGGLGYLKTGDESNVGVAAGAGLSFSIGKMLIIQPMTEINFGSTKNNMMGINLNMGIALEQSYLQEMSRKIAE